MSTVVGINNGGEIWLGSDGMATTAEGERRNVICNKIFENGDYLFGFVGSVRIGQLLTPHHFEPPSDIRDLPDEILMHLKERDCVAYSSETSVSLLESNMLIATSSGKLYEILSDFQLNEVVKYTAIGSGSYFACGSLHTTRNQKNADKRIMKALHAASEFDTSTGPPYTVQKY